MLSLWPREQARRSHPVDSAPRASRPERDPLDSASSGGSAPLLLSVGRSGAAAWPPLCWPLRGFASNNKFDASAYEEAFGVRHAGGQRYWPAVRSTELTDDFILGHGQRHVADALEKRLDELEGA